MNKFKLGEYKIIDDSYNKLIFVFDDSEKLSNDGEFMNYDNYESNTYSGDKRWID